MQDRCWCFRLTRSGGFQPPRNEIGGWKPPLRQPPRIFGTFSFSGALEELYATLVVKLHHTGAFEVEYLRRFTGASHIVDRDRNAEAHMWARPEDPSHSQLRPTPKPTYPNPNPL